MSEEDDEELFESLEQETEDDPSIAHLREARIQQLSSELSRARALRSEGCGVYAEIKDEKELLDITTSRKQCVVHFSKSDFNRCRIMDEHLKTLAEQHLEARICKINVENAPFLVTKLNVKILPCVIGFLDGVSVDRIIGFEGLSYSGDTFETPHLEKRLAKVGVFDNTFVNLAQHRPGNSQKGFGEGKKGTSQSDDEDDDFED